MEPNRDTHWSRMVARCAGITASKSSLLKGVWVWKIQHSLWIWHHHLRGLDAKEAEPVEVRDDHLSQIDAALRLVTPVFDVLSIEKQCFLNYSKNCAFWSRLETRLSSDLNIRAISVGMWVKNAGEESKQFRISSPLPLYEAGRYWIRSSCNLMIWILMQSDDLDHLLGVMNLHIRFRRVIDSLFSGLRRTIWNNITHYWKNMSRRCVKSRAGKLRKQIVRTVAIGEKAWGRNCQDRNCFDLIWMLLH
jgi:hypothetical protein